MYEYFTTNQLTYLGSVGKATEENLFQSEIATYLHDSQGGDEDLRY
jgi:hypothetical protein